MQRVLEKMAKKLNEYDEASLMMLWQQYAEQVHDFEPTKRWEEATLSLCLIQAVHWKNQLFNYHLAVQAAPPDKSLLPPMPDFFNKQDTSESVEKVEEVRPKATVLQFSPKMRRRPSNTSPLDEASQDVRMPESPTDTDGDSRDHDR